MGWFKWVRNRLERTRMKPERPQKEHDHVEGLHGKAVRSANYAWARIAVSSLHSESPNIMLLDEIDQRSPKR